MTSSALIVPCNEVSPEVGAQLGGWGAAALLGQPSSGMLWWGLALPLLGMGAMITVVAPQVAGLEANWRC